MHQAPSQKADSVHNLGYLSHSEASFVWRQRQTSIGAWLPDRGEAIAPRVAQILGAELGWGETRQALEVESYLASAYREFDVPPPGGSEPATLAELAVD